MGKLEKAYFKLQQMESRSISAPSSIDVRINVLVNLIYLAVILSVPIGRLSMLVWFALFPIINSAIQGIGFGGIFLKSLYILPFVGLIGIFNPILDHAPAFYIGSIVVSKGWVSFFSILIRGMMALQCILILINSYGFLGVCRGLRKLGIPRFLTDQLQFVYRYMSVLMLEALAMRRAREARGYGKKSFPIKLWGIMIGQLFIRAIDRSERINKAMLARGFNGTIPSFSKEGMKINVVSWIYFVLMIASIILLRLYDLSTIFSGFA